MTKTQELLLAAVGRAAAKKGVPNEFGLAELEVSYGGPASGAAGAVVRKWPDGGIEHKGHRLSRGKDGRRTVVRVEGPDITMLLGAEGVAETAGEPWIRDATEEEAGALREKVGGRRYEALVLDGMGRPYFPVVVSGSAPGWARKSASTHIRRIRL
jgi:hypothetical protein